MTENDLDLEKRTMKIYLCYGLDWDGNLTDPIAYTDKEEAEKDMNGWEEIELKFGEKWILPFKIGEKI